MTQPPSAPARLRGLTALVLFVLCSLAPLSARGQDCPNHAYFEAGPRLVSVDSQRSILLNALLGDLLDTSLSLTVADWNALASTEVSVFDFLNMLETQTSASSPSDALTTDASLFDLFTAFADVAGADGNTAAATVLDDLALSLNGLTGQLKIGDLLKVSAANGALSIIEVNLLQVVQGMIELYNYDNVATTPSGVTVSGSAIGLGSLLNEVQVFAQVIEPPVILFGPVGQAAHTAALRVKLDMDLVDVTGSTTVSTLPLDVTVADLSLYLEVARADAVISLVDWITPRTELQATPGVTDAYLGQFDDAVFFNRSTTSASLATSLAPAVIGSVTSGLSTTDLLAKAHTQGEAATGSALAFTFVSYPETKTVGTSASFVVTLVDNLFNNLDVSLGGSLSLPGVGTAAIVAALKPQVALLSKPVLKSVVSGLGDPVLDLLGIQLGEADVTVLGNRGGCL